MGFDPYWENETRKLIKRKHSDAGETGRALEELRGSLYNELRASDGAKRQQQRICGPVAAMTFNFMASVGIILSNKLVMSKIGFNYPIFLTVIHYVIAWFLLAIFNALSLLPVSPPSKSTPFTSLFTLGVVMSFASGLSNASLNLNSAGFYQMAKIAVTPTIVLSEFILFKKTISFKRVLALVVVSAGIGIATVSDIKFNFIGACIALVWIIPSAINKILWSNLQQQANWTALALMWKTTPVTVFFLLALMPWLDPPGVLLFKWDLNNSTAILITALFAFLLQWSGALALGATSAISHVVLGQFKTCAIMLGSYLFFNDNPGFVSICGVAVALLGMSAYTLISMKESQERQANQCQNHTLPLSKPKADLQTSAAEDAIYNSDATDSTT